jgi:adenosylhomocysteine nucleosidase
MGQDSVSGLVFATLVEAKPFIENLALKETKIAPFPIYANGGLHLIISGIGKVNAAMAATYLIVHYRPGRIFNLGAAGAAETGFELGESYHIEKVVEPDRPHLRTKTPYEHMPQVVAGFAPVILATQDRPVIDFEDRKAVPAQLVDMEGAAVVAVCKRFQTPCYLFKFVSDTLEHTEGEFIRAHIRQYRDSFFSFCRSRVLPPNNL